MKLLAQTPGYCQIPNWMTLSRPNAPAETEPETERSAMVDQGLPGGAKLKVLAVLPNLVISTPVESTYLAILPGNDPRIERISDEYPAVRALINGFSDRHGSKCPVSAMVFREDSPAEILNAPAMVSFRNAFAISCICRGYQFAVRSPNVYWPLYSDYFDFYPFKPTKDGKDLLHIGAGLHSLESPKGFHGQTCPELPGMNHFIRAEADNTLLSLLMSAWKKRFEQGRRDWASNRLFRSLATAYHAASLPKKNDLWFYDLGVGIALWVSALEILSHPGRDGKADLQAVLDLLGQAELSRKALERRRQIRHRGRVIMCKAPGTLYHRLYKSRNDFLHGNPVTPLTAIYERQRGRPYLTQVAPLVYSVALLCHCGHFSRNKVIPRDNSKPDFSRLFALSPLKRALEEVISTRERQPF